MLKQIKLDVDIFGSISNNKDIKGNNNINELLNLRNQKYEIEKFKNKECVFQ